MLVRVEILTLESKMLTNSVKIGKNLHRRICSSFPLHPEQISENPCDFEEIRKYILTFTIVICEKTVFTQKQLKNTFDPRIILHNYILY